MESRKIPKTLQEAYDLRDASDTPEERGFYQEHVYRLRAKGYRSRSIKTEVSVRRREQSRAEALQTRSWELRAEDGGAHHPWWKRLFQWE